MQDNLAALETFAKVMKVKTTVECEMLSSSPTL